MANLVDTGVNGDLRVTGKIYGTVNAVAVANANSAIPEFEPGEYVGSTGDYFVASGSNRNLPNDSHNFNIHTTVNHYEGATYRLTQIATPTSSTNPTGIYERSGISSDGSTWTFSSWMSTAPTSHASTGTGYGVGTTANYGHVKLDNATPLTVGTSSADGVATGKAHIHNSLESVSRAAVTTADLDHITANSHAHMLLSQITNATSTTHDPGDGYMLSFMWDSDGAYDTQLYIPSDTNTGETERGRLKIRWRNNGSWGDWGYIPAAQNAILINNSSNLDTFKGTTDGDIEAYRWSSWSPPSGAEKIRGDDNAPAAMMIVYKTAAQYATQIVYTANSGMYYRFYNGVSSVWGSWYKIITSGNVMGGASSSAAGTVGLVPAPAAGNQGKFLRGDGTWATPSDIVPCAYCETAAGTAAKTATCTNYTATPNTYLHVLIRYANTSASALTLNVNGQGAKTIYINGSASSSSNYTLPAGTYLAFYDGTYYRIRTDGKLDAASTKTAGFADAVYIRSKQSGNGWFKIAESTLMYRRNSDVNGVWMVTYADASSEMSYDILRLDVRYNASGDGNVIKFDRTYENNLTEKLKFAVRVSGTAGSTDTQVQLWVWSYQSYNSVSIRQVSGDNWSLSSYNNDTWIYYSGNTGGTSKPVADSANHISVTDCNDIRLRHTSYINAGVFSVNRGGTGMSTATYKNSVLIGNSTTVTDAMQTVRTASGAFYATAQDAKPTFGTLPIAQGGTGKTSAEDACNAFINALSTGAATPEDNDYYVAQYSGGGTTTTSYHRRPVSALWSYIKGKMSSDSAVNISGNAATASKLGKSNLGSDTKPIYLSLGTATECKAYAGGTAVTLNGTSAAASTASFYAPTSAGKHHRFLRSNGSGAPPSWEPPACDYVIQGNTWDSSHTKIIWAFRLKLDSQWSNPHILFSFDTYFWNAQKSSSDLIYIGWSNNGNQGFSTSLGRVRVGGNDNVSGNDRPLKYYYVKTSAATASECTLDIYIAPSVAGNSYGTFYVSVLNNSGIDLDDFIEKKGTLNVALPDNAVEIPYTGIIGNAVTANDYNTSGGTIKTALDNKANKASVTAATKCKITYNSDGIVTAGGDLTASDIPVGNMYDNMNAFETDTTPWLCYEISDIGLTANYRAGTAEIIVYMYRTNGNTVHLSYKVSVNWNRTGANVEVEGTDISGSWTAFIVNSATPASTDVTTLKLYFTPSAYTTYRLNLVSCKMRGNREETINGTIVKKTVQEAFPTESALVIKGTTVEKKLLNNGDVVSTYSGTGTAPVNGKAVKEAIDTRSPTSHTHSVKINGAEKTIAATGGNAVDLGNYPDYVYFGNSSPIGSGSPADQCKTYFTSTAPAGKIRTGYNYNGDEYTLIFSKQAGGNYGNIIKYGYASKYIYILRCKNSTWLDTGDWEKISAGYADSAGSANQLRIVASASKTYLAGVLDPPTSAIQSLDVVANTNVYATAGQLHATSFDVNSKCTLQFNATTNALDFVFA